MKYLGICYLFIICLTGIFAENSTKPIFYDAFQVWQVDKILNSTDSKNVDVKKKIIAKIEKNKTYIDQKEIVENEIHIEKQRHIFLEELNKNRDKIILSPSPSLPISMENWQNLLISTPSPNIMQNRIDSLLYYENKIEPNIKLDAFNNSSAPPANFPSIPDDLVAIKKSVTRDFFVQPVEDNKWNLGSNNYNFELVNKILLDETLLKKVTDEPKEKLWEKDDLKNFINIVLNTKGINPDTGAEFLKSFAENSFSLINQSEVPVVDSVVLKNYSLSSMEGMFDKALSDSWQRDVLMGLSSLILARAREEAAHGFVNTIRKITAKYDYIKKVFPLTYNAIHQTDNFTYSTLVPLLSGAVHRDMRNLPVNTLDLLSQHIPDYAAIMKIIAGIFEDVLNGEDPMYAISKLQSIGKSDDFKDFMDQESLNSLIILGKLAEEIYMSKGMMVKDAKVLDYSKIFLEPRYLEIYAYLLVEELNLDEKYIHTITKNVPFLIIKFKEFSDIISRVREKMVDFNGLREILATASSNVTLTLNMDTLNNGQLNKSADWSRLLTDVILTVQDSIELCKLFANGKTEMLDSILAKLNIITDINEALINKKYSDIISLGIMLLESFSIPIFSSGFDENKFAKHFKDLLFYKRDWDAFFEDKILIFQDSMLKDAISIKEDNTIQKIISEEKAKVEKFSKKLTGLVKNNIDTIKLNKNLDWRTRLKDQLEILFLDDIKTFFIVIIKRTIDEKFDKVIAEKIWKKTEAFLLKKNVQSPSPSWETEIKQLELNEDVHKTLEQIGTIMEIKNQLIKKFKKTFSNDTSVITLITSSLRLIKDNRPENINWLLLLKPEIKKLGIEIGSDKINEMIDEVFFSFIDSNISSKENAVKIKSDLINNVIPYITDFKKAIADGAVNPPVEISDWVGY